MGKRRRRNRTKGPPAAVMIAEPPRSRENPAIQGDPAAFNRAVPLTNRDEPLVEPARRFEAGGEDLKPLPRSQSLAVQNYGMFARLGPWFRRLFYKPPPSQARKEMDFTRKQLKDLRRQITLMERTLERMS